MNADVAVIGSGIAGLIAACRALSMGKSVIILEKNGYFGGSSISRSSNVVATGSKVSKKVLGEKIKKDSSNKLLEDITRRSSGTNYPILSKLLVDFIAEFADLNYQATDSVMLDYNEERQIDMSLID